MQFPAGLFSLVVLLPLLSLAAKNPKRGVPFSIISNTEPGDIAKANQSSSAISWVYNYQASIPSYLASSGLEYIPMQWGSDGISSFVATVEAEGAKTILTFNEPDSLSESNISPAVAAQLWMTYIQPLKAQGVRLGAPAVTNPPSGVTWLTQFLQICTACSVDFIPLHWSGDGVDNFIEYIESFHNKFPSYPLWVTEYASTSTDDAVLLDFLNQTSISMDSLTWIERYAWFGFFRNTATSHDGLLDTSGNLNALGELYVNGS